MKDRIFVVLGFLAFMFLGKKLFGKSVKVIDISEILPKSGNYPIRDLSDIKYIVVHHTGSDNQDSLDYANYHINQRGWPGIGYHFVIDKDGLVNKTNKLESVSNHVRGNNTASIGIAISGNLDNHEMTESQRRSLYYLIKQLKSRYPNWEVKFHKDFVSTGCPGLYVDTERIKRETF